MGCWLMLLGCRRIRFETAWKPSWILGFIAYGVKRAKITVYMHIFFCHKLKIYKFDHFCVDRLKLINQRTTEFFTSDPCGSKMIGLLAGYPNLIWKTVNFIQLVVSRLFWDKNEWSGLVMSISFIESALSKLSWFKSIKPVLNLFNYKNGFTLHQSHNHRFENFFYCFKYNANHFKCRRNLYFPLDRTNQNFLHFLTARKVKFFLSISKMLKCVT